MHTLQLKKIQKAPTLYTGWCDLIKNPMCYSRISYRLNSHNSKHSCTCEVIKWVYFIHFKLMFSIVLVGELELNKNNACSTYRFSLKLWIIQAYSVMPNNSIIKFEWRHFVSIVHFPQPIFDIPMCNYRNFSN